MKKGQIESTLLILVTLSLVAFGLVMVYSATSAPATLGGGDPGYYLKKQTVYALVGLGLMLGATRFDYRRLKDASPLLVAGAAFLCLIGARPGCLRQRRAPLAHRRPGRLPAVRARQGRDRRLGRRVPDPAQAAADARRARPARSGSSSAVFALLIMLEPDLGTTITLMLMLIGVLVVAGTPMRLVATSTVLVSASASPRSGSSPTGASASSASSTRGTTSSAPASRACRR